MHGLPYGMPFQSLSLAQNPDSKTRARFALDWILTAALSLLPFASLGQSNLTIYADSLAAGWLDYSYGITRNFANTSPVHSGSYSISVTITNAYGGLQLFHSPLTNSAFAFISFWLNGGSSGGQQLQMYGNLGPGPTAQTGRFSLAAPSVNSWRQYFVPLAALDVNNATNFSGFAIQDSAGSTEPTFYLDDIQLISSTPPAVTHLTVDAGQSVRTADARWFGMNGAIWDSALDSPSTLNALSNMGTRAMRFPGGSDSDDYHWVTNRQTGANFTWTTSTAHFIHLVTNANVQSMITLNYGTGSTNEAAAWVAYVNAPTNSPVPLGTDPTGLAWQTAGYWASLRAAAPLGVDDGKKLPSYLQAVSARVQILGGWQRGLWELGNRLQFVAARSLYVCVARSRLYLSRESGGPYHPCRCGRHARRRQFCQLHRPSCHELAHRPGPQRLDARAACHLEEPGCHARFSHPPPLPPISRSRKRRRFAALLRGLGIRCRHAPSRGIRLLRRRRFQHRIALHRE
ncbi:hypothetical protein SBV1_700016 [Verrucomicrobia bacterium]|nr:hypothetical protein SBV1_700016 [Verrucomicrobiota bacterium]